MRIRLHKVLVIFKLAVLIAGNVNAQMLTEKKDLFEWDLLPSIPDETGFAGSFAGVADGVLVVAGGSNFPNGGTPWNGGSKKWYDKIFILEEPGGKWKEAGTLPFPLGYGVSVSTKHGLLIIGGSNEQGHVANVFLLHYRNGKVQIDNLPSLPFPLANSSGALVGDKIYIAGGLTSPLSRSTLHKFLSFDLQQLTGSWTGLPAWPGASRMLAVVAASNDHFYLFSGTKLMDNKRVYLNDAYSFSEKTGWQRLADLPTATVAAPSPAFNLLHDQWIIFGGDNGEQAQAAASLKEKHPGLSNKLLRYDARTNTWSAAGEMLIEKNADFVEKPNNSIWAPVTTPLVIWKDKIIIPGGEVRPGTRTPHVLVANPLK